RFSRDWSSDVCSSDLAAANAGTARVADRLSRGTRWAGVEMAFATMAGSVPQAVERLQARGAERLMIAPWFLAHGKITDGIAEYEIGSASWRGSVESGA